MTSPLDDEDDEVLDDEEFDEDKDAEDADPDADDEDETDDEEEGGWQVAFAGLVSALAGEPNLDFVG